MFALADNQKIGQYLASRIDERFDSRRRFCKAYLAAKGEDSDDILVQNMSNRLSQILKGKKELQLYDLPLFCRLLEISCEDILSAGTSHAPAPMRLTNYAAAFSADEREWEDYVNRPDSPILNADEFGKNFIDYALEAENYGLLKYLMDKQYIWFVGADEEDFFTGFGAGTSIEKSTFPYPGNLNVLAAQMSMRDKLRTHMIALAIRHKDMEMLEQLHAKEIPTLYQMIYYSSPPLDCKQYYDEKLMDALAEADNQILAYFSEAFEITDRLGNSQRFLFPFLGELIERLLQNQNCFAEYLLKNAILHNQYVYDQLTVRFDNAVQYFRSLSYDFTNAEVTKSLNQGIQRDLSFYDDGRLVSYFTLLKPRPKKGLISDIVQVNAESSDPLIDRRISELNDLYDAIHHITPNLEGGTNL